MSPAPLCREKWGGGRHDPQAPMGAPPLLHNEATWELLAIGLTLKNAIAIPQVMYEHADDFKGRILMIASLK